MANRIENALITADQWCDCTPFSFVNNIVDLFQKCVVIPLMGKARVAKSPYYTYLEQKSFSRCITLLIPLLGCVIVGIYDFIQRKHNDHDYMLDLIRRKGVCAILDASARLRDDGKFMLAAFLVNRSVLSYATDRLKDNSDFMLSSIKQHVVALAHASVRLRDDEAFMLAAARINIRALMKASDRLKNDDHFWCAVDQLDPTARDFLQTTSKRNDPDFMQGAIKRKGLSELRSAGADLKDNYAFMLDAIEQLGMEALTLASERLQRDKGFQSLALERSQQMLKRLAINEID